jgi:hypothetical protein
MNPRITLTINIPNQQKNLSSDMDLPSRSEPYKKNEIKTFPPCFSIFPSHRTDKVVNSQCTLLRGRRRRYIYKDHAYKDHNSTRPMR